MPDVSFKHTTKRLQRVITDVARELKISEGKALRRADSLLLQQISKEHLTGGTTATRLAVRTGRLRSSITDRFLDTPEGPVLIIGTNVVYAATHEFGDARRKIRERSFLRSSLREKANEIERFFAEEAERAIA